MSQPLPVDSFEWAAVETISIDNIMSWKDHGTVGHILEVNSLSITDLKLPNIKKKLIINN